MEGLLVWSYAPLQLKQKGFSTRSPAHLHLYIRVPEVVRKRLARSKARKEKKDAAKVAVAKVIICGFIVFSFCYLVLIIHYRKQPGERRSTSSVLRSTSSSTGPRSDNWLRPRDPPRLRVTSSLRPNPRLLLLPESVGMLFIFIYLLLL